MECVKLSFTLRIHFLCQRCVRRHFKTSSAREWPFVEINCISVVHLMEPDNEPDRLTSAEVGEYLDRIHYTGPIEPTIDVLSQLHRCHMLSVPFENLSVFGKEKIVLSKDWLFAKIVKRHRGGFCFELNTIFSLLLNSLGFKHEKHAGMVFSRKTGRIGPPFDHMILLHSLSD